MIDQNRDGFIDNEDLKDMLASLGQEPSDSVVDGMMSEAPGPLNFTMFLTLFGEKLTGELSLSLSPFRSCAHTHTHHEQTPTHKGPGRRGGRASSHCPLIRNAAGLAKDIWHATYPTSFFGLAFYGVCSENMIALSPCIQARTLRMSFEMPSPVSTRKELGRFTKIGEWCRQKGKPVPSTSLRR
jgi:hypothetical protein